MIKKTRIKITIVTTAILAVVFLTVGVVAFTIMTNRPRPEPREGSMYKYNGAEFDDAIKELESQIAREWLLWYSLVALGGLTGLSVLTYFLSGWIVKPIKESMEKQKQFVSDASHELKTPISIISANADVLSNGETDNKWLQNIKAQSKRMQLLTNDLLTLARVDETKEEKNEKLNLSEMIASVVLGFESVAFEEDKTLSTDISANIYCFAVREEVVKVCNILIDNAIKYSGSNASIKVSLASKNNKTTLEVFNTGSGIPETEQTRIFDRFYRSDYSRTRQSGGSGLGLAIVKSIMDKNSWKVSVDSDGNSFVSFVIQI